MNTDLHFSCDYVLCGLLLDCILTDTPRCYARNKNVSKQRCSLRTATLM